MPELLHGEITSDIIQDAIDVHKELGPGLPKKAYSAALSHMLKQQGHAVETDVELPVLFQEQEFECGFTVDMLVDDNVLVEIRCLERMNTFHEAQFRSILKQSDMEVGLMINFYSRRLRDGLRRQDMAERSERIERNQQRAAEEADDADTEDVAVEVESASETVTEE